MEAVFELSDSTKVKIAADMLKYYYKHKDNKNYNGEKIEAALRKVEEEEKEYFLILRDIYRYGWSISKTARKIPCGSNTVLRKRDKMLLMLFDEVLAGIIFPAISFAFFISLQFVVR
jgi:hypothetical protein